MRNCAFIFLIIVIAACKKEYDHAPYKAANDGNRISISTMKQRLALTPHYRFGAGDTNLYCTVTADESSGNLYREIYVTDESGAGLLLKLVNSGGLIVGDHVRINLNRLYLVKASNMIFLDSVDLEKNAVKISSGSPVGPVPAKIADILQYKESPVEAGSYQSKLVEISGVQFPANRRGKPIGDAIGKSAVSDTLVDCQGNTIVLRTSGFANFASKNTPTGSGKIIAIVSQFGSTMQLVLRNYTDLQMNSPICYSANTNTQVSGTVLLSKDFNDLNITSGGWSSLYVTGTVPWTTSSVGSSSPYGKISNFLAGANVACESWLVSPPVDLSVANNPVLSFKNAYNFAGTPLELYVSTTYTDGAVSSASWTKLSYNQSPGAYAFVSSGEIPLQAYKSANTRIAFRYLGSSVDGSTWELDDIRVIGQ